MEKRGEEAQEILELYNSWIKEAIGNAIKDDYADNNVHHITRVNDDDYDYLILMRHMRY